MAGMSHELIQYIERLEANNMAFKSSYFNIETGKVVTVDNAPLGILGFLLQICSMLSWKTIKETFRPLCSVPVRAHVSQFHSGQKP